jgi:hypothetical protein
MAWLVGRQVTRLACVLVMAACTHDTVVSGKVPERITRDLHSTPVGAKDRGELYKQRQADASAAGSRVEQTDPADARIGVASTHEFHMPGCSRLKDVPVADQVRFTSKWDGLDAGYRPCDECKALR